MRRIISCLGILGVLILVGFGLWRVLEPIPENPKIFEPSISALRLPELESEQSPYFSRDRRYSGQLKLEEVLLFRKDRCVGKFYYRPDGTLREVRCYRTDGEGEQIAYFAEYDISGRRILQANYYNSKGQIETQYHRRGEEQVFHFCKNGEELQMVKVSADGTQTSSTFAGRKTVSTVVLPGVLTTQDLIHWDSGKKKVRLRVTLQGTRLKSWEYFTAAGKLEHRGVVLADGSLNFEFLENAKVKRRQLWKLVGEDWERSYYGMSCSELLADDGKTVEHRVWVRSNGSLKSHERYNGKTGKLEMHRDFDLEGRVERIEDFDENGGSQRRLVFPPSGNRGRGFVPDRMRDYPGEDRSAGNVYNLDGMPFSHSVLDRHPWSFINVPASK